MSDPMPAIRSILGMPAPRVLLNGEPWLATVTLPDATAGEIADWLDDAPGTGLTVEHTGIDSVVDVIGGIVNFAPGETS